MSACICVYGLLVIYHAVHEERVAGHLYRGSCVCLAAYEELHSSRVIQKFIAMKLIIILSAFQSSLIDGARHASAVAD
eukprot:2086207-Amphidinium_carterae.1